MKHIVFAFALILPACVHVPSVRTADHFSQPEPQATVEEAKAAAPVIVDVSELNVFTHHDPVGVARGTAAPFTGVLLSERDSAYNIKLEAAAIRLNEELAATRWQLARLERADAVLAHTYEDRIDVLARENARRRRWVRVGIPVIAVIALGSGIYVGSR